MATLPITAVGSALSWTDGAVDLGHWRSTFEALLQDRLRARLAANEDYRCVVAALDLLAPATRRRFLRAPAVSTLLLQGDERGEVEAGLLAGLVMAELTADGSGPVGEHLLAGTEIVLDTGSPFVFPDDEFGIENTVVHPPDERRLVEERLSAAVDVLRGLPEALPFAETFIEVLALRREPGTSGTFYTSSFSGLIGLTRFTNAHAGSVDAALLAEGLLHEATHGMLYLYEEVSGPFVLRPEANRIAVTSPWTGATIRLQSLVHACAVWYGTYWFLRRALDAGLVGGDRPEQRLELARRGFRRGPVTSALAAHSGLLAPTVVEFLGEIEDAMLRV